MDRLIDAEELHEIINWTHMKPPFSKKAVHRYIDMARTVEAIPVEWINKYANEHRAYIHAFAEMVVCWNERKEE